VNMIRLTEERQTFPTFGCIEPLVCAGDAEAIEKAKLLVGDRSIELWNGPRFVSRLEPEQNRSQNGTKQLSAPSSLLAQSRNRYAASIHPDLPEMQPSSSRDDGDRFLPVLLRLQRVRRTAQAPCRRLLRVLLLRIGAVPADTGQHALLRAGGSLRSRE
jgi:hypothetical protein